MISLVEFCKYIRGDIFGRSDSQLKWLRNITHTTFFLGYHHRHNWMLQYLCAYGYSEEKDKEELIKVEAMSINISDRSGDGDVARVSFMSI